NQILTFSEDRMIVAAMHEFRDGFNLIEKEVAPNKRFLEKVNQNLTHYFNHEYLKRLNRNLFKKSTIKKETSQNLATRILQNFYLFTNKNKVGEKHLLDYSKDSTTYSKTHRLYHPIIRSYLERFGFYDIFLIDIETGNIVYT